MIYTVEPTQHIGVTRSLIKGLDIVLLYYYELEWLNVTPISFIENTHT